MNYDDKIKDQQRIIRILEEENTKLKLKLEYEKESRISCEKLFRNYRLKLIREQNKITKKCLIEKNETLNNIIKEVREEIRILETNHDIVDYQAQKLYQILDTGDKHD